MRYRKFSSRIIFLALFLGAVAAHAAVPIAQVSRLTGSNVAEARTPDGVSRKLAQGDPVHVGERISTGAGTGMQIEFTDKARFILGPNSGFEVEKYRQAREGAEEEAFHSRVFKGGFRFVSGLIAKSKGRKMTVSVSVATIGIRGTHVEGEVTERQEKNGVTVDASAKVALLEPEERGQTSIEVSNDFGSVVIDKPGYGTVIPDEKSPPSPVRKMQLRTIENIQRALRNSTRQGGAARPRTP